MPCKADSNIIYILNDSQRNALQGYRKWIVFFWSNIVRQIHLGNNKYAKVDDDNYARLSVRNWYLHRTGYAATNVTFKLDGRKSTIFMHQLVIDLPEDYDGEIDHKDGDKLDNRRSKLRACTHSQNLMNQSSHEGSSSPYKGVSWRKGLKKWVATLSVNKKQHYLGSFFCIMKAAKAYDEAAIKYHGEFAKVNFP